MPFEIKSAFQNLLFPPTFYIKCHLWENLSDCFKIGLGSDLANGISISREVFFLICMALVPPSNFKVRKKFVSA